MNEFDDILLEKTDLDIDTIINDLNPINFNYDTLKQELNTIRDKRTIQWIDGSNYSLNKLEGNTFDGFYQLIDLNLSHNILTNLPRDIFNQLLNLQTINLSHNLISELQDSLFKNNKQLRNINLSNNLLNKLNGRAFDNLSLLRKLDFSYNRIESLTKRTVNSISLQDFNLSYNIISEVKPIAFCLVPNLIHLQLNNNNILHLIDNLFHNTKSIEYLNLSNNFILKLDKKTFTYLHKLRQIDVSNNLLTSLGKCFEDKLMLNEINLLNNPINKSWVKDLFLGKNIRILKLSIDKLLSLKALMKLQLLSDFELHVKTEELFLLNESFLSLINPASIQKLYIVIQRGAFNVSNKINNFFNLEFLHIEFLEEIELFNVFNISDSLNLMLKLKHLALRNINQLRVIKNSGIKHNNLTYLDLTGITNISIDFLRNDFLILQYLNLSFSYIEYIPRDFMKTLPNLKYFIMNNTRITIIIDNLFHNNNKLEIIEFMNCQIHTIGENCFQNLENLKKIDIRGNTQLRITQNLLNEIPNSAIVYYD